MYEHREFQVGSRLPIEVVAAAFFYFSQAGLELRISLHRTMSGLYHEIHFDGALQFYADDDHVLAVASCGQGKHFRERIEPCGSLRHMRRVFHGHFKSMIIGKKPCPLCRSRGGMDSG